MPLSRWFPYLHLIVWSISLATVDAATVQVGGDESTGDVCSAIGRSRPGDVIEISGDHVIGQCAWDTPGLTIRGVNARPVLSLKADSGWTVAARDTRIENIVLSGDQCGTGPCVAVTGIGGDLTMTHVAIRNTTVGLRTSDAVDYVRLTNCVFSGNSHAVDIGRARVFELHFSVLRLNAHAIKTAAIHNVLRNNRLESGRGITGSELSISGGVQTQLTGSVIIRSGAAFAGGLIEVSGDAGSEPQVMVEHNTIVNRARTGIAFVESEWLRTPSVVARKNILWGYEEHSLTALGADSSDNYLTSETIFRGETDLSVMDGRIPPDWGAAPIDDSGFPLIVPGDQPTHASKQSVKSTVATPGPQSVVLSTSQMGGAGYVWDNKVYLSSPAPAEGLVLTMNSSNPSVAVPLSSTVLVRAGVNVATFSIRTFATSVPTPVAIVATANGGSASATLTVSSVALATVVASQATFGTNATVTGNRVTLTGPALSGGMVISLTLVPSSAAAFVDIPAAVTVPAGMSSITFPIRTGVVSSPQTVTLQASHTTGASSVSFTVAPSGVSTLMVAPATVAGNQMPIIRTHLNGPAPAAGLTVRLASSHPHLVPVPATIFVLPGATSAAVIPTASYVSSTQAVNIFAASDYGSAMGIITVVPTQVSMLYTPVSSPAWYAKTAITVRLNGPAPIGGLVVELTSSDTNTTSVPSAVTVPSGGRDVIVPLACNKVAVGTPVTITATGGGTRVAATLTIMP